MIKKVESLTGSLSMPRGSVMNDYEKLINKPLVFDSSTNFPPTGNAERLYIATNVNKIYYWTGVTYADISGSGGGGTDGKSPYVGENGNWFEYNDVLQAWTDTGVKAEGKDGVNGLDGINGADGKDGIDGTSITSALVNNDGDLIVTLDTGVSSNAGHVKGADGASINIKGDLLSPDDLPSSNQELGDCYIILGHLWVYVDSTDIGAVNGFKDVGNIQGVDGKSAYEIALEDGFTGTEAEWLASLKGAKGDTGQDGKDGINGVDGADGAKGDKGDKGDTGDKGIDGINGEDGYTPVKGTDYFTADDIANLGINPTIITNLSATTQTVTLENNTEYRYGTLTSLTITWTTSDIHSAIAFTGGTGVTFSITSGVKIVGTDVADNVFTPVVNKRYNLGFEYDGINRTMYVSGVE